MPISQVIQPSLEQKKSLPQACSVEELGLEPRSLIQSPPHSPCFCLGLLQPEDRVAVLSTEMKTQTEE